MNSVWIVEEGEYSGYQVLAIFGTEDQAKEFCSHRKESSYREWTLNTWTEDRATFSFRFDLDGNILSAKEEAFIEDEYAGHLPAISAQRSGWDGVVVIVRRGPRETALKMASERFFRVRAFLDEATERVNARVMEAEHLRIYCTWMLAEVLAGLWQIPQGNRSRFDEMIAEALSNEPAPLAPQV